MNHLIMLLQEYGLGLVFVNVLALQAGLPVPAYPVLIVAGAYAAMGGSPLWQLVAVCRMSLSPDTCVRQTESIFQRFGPASMLFAKFVPGFASVATALAGALRLNYLKFVLFDAGGAALWVGVAVGLGYVFNNAIGEVMRKLSDLGRYGVLIVI